MIESQAINNIAAALYDFLPGKPNPYADPSISFEGITRKMGLSPFWTGGSKLPAITRLLESVLEFKRSEFCELILEIVRKGMIYRNNKGIPLTKEELKRINTYILGVNFKIPELWDPMFLDNLPSTNPKNQETIQTDITATRKLKDELLSISELQPQARGYAFEKFLNTIFLLNRLAPKSAFRLIGEQIDGSFEIGNDTYLLEAKWQKDQISAEQLRVFRDKVETKSTWARGLFISESGFTAEALQAITRGKSTCIIGMSGQDLYFILEGQISLASAISKKARYAAETGCFYISVFELLKEI